MKISLLKNEHIMRNKLITFLLVVCFAFAANAQWAIDSTNTAGVNMYAASTSTAAVFSNGTEWNVFNATTGVHTWGNLTIARTMIDVVSIGDKVYFAGGKFGYFADPQYTKTVNVYNSATNTWSTLTMKTAREVGGAGALGNKVVFAGGTGRADIAGPVYMYNKVDIFDVTTGARTNASLSKGRSNIACGAAGTKIVFAGGWYWDMMYSILPSNNVDIYDITTGVWTKTTLSKKRDNITAAVIGNKILFAGGTSNMGDVTNVDVYDVSTNTWSVIYMPAARSSMRTATIGTTAYFAGGTGGVANDVYAYNSATNVWTTLSMPTALTGFSMSVINNKLYFAGGTLVAGGAYSNLLQIYDPATNSWSTETLSIARTGVAATTVAGKGYFAGGTIIYGYPTPTNTKRVDIYTAPLRIVAEEMINPIMEMQLYPNPAHDIITVDLKGITSNATAVILDFTGNEVMRLKLDEANSGISISNLIPGTYIMVVTDESDMRVVKKFIKQ